MILNFEDKFDEALLINRSFDPTVFFMQNYQQTIEYLFSRLPMFSRIGAAAYKNDLTNTLKLCEALGNPQTKFKSIHIAGTNGKGSTSHMMAAILQTAGYKTGLYTSPHLKDFRERIKIDGEMVSEDFVIQFTQKIKPLIEEIEPSFFEITVAMAFDWFASNKVDIAVVEVGLGGRLDSTNIIIPQLCIITNISYDHMNMLGNSIEEIAWEKAGIIKQHIPVVIGQTNDESKHVFQQKATQVEAKIYFSTDRKWVTDWVNEKHVLTTNVEDKLTKERKNYSLDLNGNYQTKNILAVLTAVDILNEAGWHIDNKDVQLALTQVKKLTGLHGRWEMIHQNPLTIIDVAHNEDGIKEVVKQLEYFDNKKLHLVIGMVKDKEIDKVLSLLPKYATYYFTKANIPRALPENELAEKAKSFGLNGACFNSVKEALQQAVNDCHHHDLVLVFGSVFVVGEVDVHSIQWKA